MRSQKQQNKIEQNGNVAYIHSRRKKTRRRGSSSKFIKLLLVGILLLACISFSPLFSAKNIVVTKMEKYTTAEICEKIGLSNASNLFLFGKSQAIKQLTQDPYIQSAKIITTLPNTITIDIKERRVRGYVPYMDSYLYIDEFGRVLDVQTSFEKVLPIVRGLEFDSFQTGEVLNVTNTESLNVVVKIAQMMTKYELLDVVLSLDVSNTKQITAFVNQVEIRLGSIDNCDQKIRTLAEIIKTIPEGDRGYLDLSDLNKNIVFQYLT